MSLLVYYSSKTGNTHHFVDQLDLPYFRIDKACPQIHVERPFVLDMLFKKQQELVVYGDTSLLEEHRHWKKALREECRVATEITDCIKGKHQERLLAMAKEPAPAMLHDFVDGYDVDVLPDHHFKLEVTDGSPKVHLTIYHKTQDKPLQRIEFADLGFRKTQEPFQNRIEIADYNLDGFPDFAIHDNKDADDDGSYLMFLYDETDGLFYYAPALGKIFDNSSIFLDNEKQELSSWSGYRYEFVEIFYQVKNNMPVPVRRLKQDREENEQLVRVSEIWKDGVWKQVKKERTSDWRGEVEWQRVED